jgi:hypothetical protein
MFLAVRIDWKPTRNTTYLRFEQRYIVQPVLNLFSAHLATERRLRGTAHRRIAYGRNTDKHSATFDTVPDLFDQSGGRPGTRINFQAKHFKDLFPLAVPIALALPRVSRGASVHRFLWA